MEGLQALRDVGETPAPEDYGPDLKWEAPVWRLYARLSRQWRIGASGQPLGIDLHVFIPCIEQMGWDLGMTLDLLTTIESAVLAKDIVEEVEDDGSEG